MKNLNIFSLVTEYENAKSEGTLITPNVSFINESGGVICLPELDDPYNGHEYVDLGLPSGLKWATCNVGASSPEEYGLYFAWGETTGYTREQVPDVREFIMEEYEDTLAASISADLTLEQDAAHVNMGGNWRMPTKAEYQELFDNCNDFWTNDYRVTGIAGRIFRSKVNGKEVFFPAAGSCNEYLDFVGSYGYYWSASWRSEYDVWNFILNHNNHYIEKAARYEGKSVRGVCE